MPLPYDAAGNYIPGSAMGAVSPGLVNPLQGQVDPAQQEATLRAMGVHRAALTKLQQAQLRAAVLRNAKMGEGPGGWATTIGSLLGNWLATKPEAEAVGEVGPASQTLAEAYARGDPNGVYGRGAPLQYISQGSPLSLGNK